MTRLEQASAFLALLELRRAGELAIEQAAPFAPIRVNRLAQETNATGKDRRMDRPLRLIASFDDSDPLDKLARTLEALLVVASSPLSVEELAEAADDDQERVEDALHLVGERFAEERSGIVLEHVAGGWAFRAAREEAAACARLFERPAQRDLSRPRSRRSRSSRTSAPARGRRSPGSAASPPTARRGPPGARPDRGSRSRRERGGASATARRRSSSASSGSRASRSYRASTMSVRTRPRSAIACTPSPRSSRPSGFSAKPS